MAEVIYLVGGPADLTKVAVPEAPHRYRVPVFPEPEWAIGELPPPAYATYFWAEYEPCGGTRYGHIYAYKP